MIITAIQNKLILAAVLVTLPIGGYYTGKLVAGNICNSKAVVKVLKADIKRREDDAEIDKTIDAMDDATVHRAYMHWMR